MQPSPLFPRLTIALLAGLVLLAAGCSSRYIITTNNGTKIVTQSKPKRVESLFVYRGADGQSNAISVLRVRAIEPYSKASLGIQPKAPELK